jgi:hypothetical protein
MAGRRDRLQHRTVHPSKGLKQGYFDGSKYYGENFFEFLRLAEDGRGEWADVRLERGSRPWSRGWSRPRPGHRERPPSTRSRSSRRRSAFGAKPRIDRDNANVRTRLPDGHVVRAIGRAQVNGFVEVETSVLGAHYRGFVAARYLEAVERDRRPRLDTGDDLAHDRDRRRVDAGRSRLRLPSARSPPARIPERAEPARPKGTTPDALRARWRRSSTGSRSTRWRTALSAARPRDVLQHLRARLLSSRRVLPGPGLWWTQPAIEARREARRRRRRTGRRSTSARERSLPLAARLRPCASAGAGLARSRSSRSRSTGRRRPHRRTPYERWPVRHIVVVVPRPTRSGARRGRQMARSSRRSRARRGRRTSATEGARELVDGRAVRGGRRVAFLACTRGAIRNISELADYRVSAGYAARRRLCRPLRVGRHTIVSCQWSRVARRFCIGPAPADLACAARPDSSPRLFHLRRGPFREGDGPSPRAAADTTGKGVAASELRGDEARSGGGCAGRKPVLTRWSADPACDPRHGGARFRRRKLRTSWGDRLPAPGTFPDRPT